MATDEEVEKGKGQGEESKGEDRSKVKDEGKSPESGKAGH